MKVFVAKSWSKEEGSLLIILGNEAGLLTDIAGALGKVLNSQ